MKWVKSGGGPLVCITRDTAQSWCGVLGTSDSLGNCVALGSSDYDRACAAGGYISAFEFRGFQGLIIGDVPLLTSFYSGPSLAAIVSIYYAPDDFDVTADLDRMSADRLGPSLAVASFESGGGEMMMFDSALAGSRVDDDVILLRINAGQHVISTHFVEDIPDVSLVLHVLMPAH